MTGFGSSKKNKKLKNLRNFSKEKFLNTAIKLHSQGNIELASKYYRYCIDNEIHDQRVFCNLGIILRDLGKLRDAEIILRKLISRQVRSGCFHYGVDVWKCCCNIA